MQHDQTNTADTGATYVRTVGTAEPASAGDVAAATPDRQSPFITELAWIFIGLAGFATIIFLLQNLMVHLMLPAADMRVAADQARLERAPWFGPFALQYFRWFILAVLLSSAATLAAAVGLLKRRNWARILFVVLMGVGILWSLMGVAATVIFYMSIPDLAALTGQGPTGRVLLMSKALVFIVTALALAFSAQFGWIAKQLMSHEVRREFFGGGIRTAAA